MENSENVWFDNISNTETKDDQWARKPVEPYLTTLDVNNGDKLLLGAAFLGGNLWTGSLWLFSSPEKAPISRNSIAGIELDVGACEARFYDDTHVIYSDFSGVLSMLSIKPAAADCPVFFTQESVFAGQDGYVATLDSSSQFSTLVTGSSNSSVFVWDVETQMSIKRYSAHKNGVSAVSIKPKESSIFVSCSAADSALVWDCRQEKPASSIVNGYLGFSSIDWADEKHLVLGDLSGSVQLIDMRSRKSCDRLVLSTCAPVKRIKVNRDNKQIAVALDKPCLHVLSINDDILKSVYESTDHSGLIRGLAWSKVTGRLHSCGWDTQVVHHTLPG